MEIVLKFSGHKSKIRKYEAEVKKQIKSACVQDWFVYCYHQWFFKYKHFLISWATQKMHVIKEQDNILIFLAIGPLKEKLLW